MIFGYIEYYYKMTEERLIEFVDKMVLADQTEIVEYLLGDNGDEDGPDHNDVIYPEHFLQRVRELDEKRPEGVMTVWEEECGQILGEELYSWKLINPDYVDVLKGCDMPYFQYEDQTWLGKTMRNCLTEWQHLKDYVKKIDNDDSDEEEEELAGDYCYGATDPATVIIYTMAGGGDHWWNYEVHYDEDGQQSEVFINNINGKSLPLPKKVLFYYEDQPDQLRLEDDDFEEDKWFQLEHYA